MNRDIYVPPGGPPQVAPPSHDLFPILQEQGFEDLLQNFYGRLATSSISDLFPKDREELKEAAHKSACFFVGLCGGPPLYHQKFGAPRLRARHLPFVIDEKARQVWLMCFKGALLEMVEEGRFPEEHFGAFWTFIEGFSVWMINTSS